jgi:hypothetical protein
MRNVLLVGGGIVCAILGVMFTPLPFPLGGPLMLVGAALILAGSAVARQMMKRLRANSERLNGWLAGAEVYLPMPLRGVLRDTCPD